MSPVQLRWDRVEARRSKRQRKEGPWVYRLFAGSNTFAVATLTQVNAWYEGWSNIGGADFSNRYGPLEKMQADIEAKVRAWFDASSRWPDARVEGKDGDGI